MYILSENQSKALDTFIAKIPESTVKGNYERWQAKVIEHNNKVATSDMDEFKALAHNLDTDLQNFPQIFSYNVKNYLEFGGKIPKAEPVEDDIPEIKKKKVVKKTVVVVHKKAPIAVKKKVIIPSKVIVPVKAVLKKKK